MTSATARQLCVSLLAAAWCLEVAQHQLNSFPLEPYKPLKDF